MPISATGSKTGADGGFAHMRRSAGCGGASVKGFAERGFTPARRFAEHGFTLVELMVVLAIIGLLTGAVVLMMPDPRGDLRQDAERFAARARAAQDAAVIEAREMALWVSTDGYGFEQRDRRGWHPITEKPFEARNWNGGQAIVGTVGRARVIFDTTGFSDPLDVTLVRDSARVVVHIESDGTIHVGS